MNASLVVEIDVSGGVAWLAAADAGVEVQPLPGVTSGYLRLEKLSVKTLSRDKARCEL